MDSLYYLSKRMIKTKIGRKREKARKRKKQIKRKRDKEQKS